MLWQVILAGLMLGVGLAMDAFAVSMTNGLNEPQMSRGKAVFVASTFGLFQAAMPMIGWLCVTLVAERFAKFAEWVPYIALVLLLIIGGKMLIEGIKHNRGSKRALGGDTGESEQQSAAETSTAKPLTFVALLVQAVATSIDALSTGFSLSDIADGKENWWQALIAVGLIGVVTFGISLAGVFIGKKFGNRLGSKAEIVGGVILIAIGIEIFVSGVFF